MYYILPMDIPVAGGIILINSYNTHNTYKNLFALCSFIFALSLIFAMFWALKMGEWIESLAGGFEAVKWLYI